MPSSRTVNVQTQVKASTMLESPETVLQQLSLKVLQRRQKLVDELIGTRVSYDNTDGTVHSGTIDRIEMQVAVLIEGNERVRVALRRLHI